jgi:CCR4-NOT transcription complex subunit 1
VPTEVDTTEQSFPPDVEEEANSYYERIYTGDLTIPKVVELLQKFKSSSTPRETLVFNCMVHNLFDEFRFFAKYPDKELLVTGELFGSLIQHQLVSPVRLALGLRHVLDSLRKPLGSKMFRFGLTALLQFQSRLVEWPQYCNHIVQISHLKDAHPEIIAMIHQTMNDTSSIVRDRPASNSLESSGQMNGSMRSLNVDTLVHAGDSDVMETPNDATVEKILFIINNASSTNLDTKVKEMRVILKESFYRWFSNYLVVKRVSIEPNFHSLYISFLDQMASKSLEKAALIETYNSIKVLLVSEKTLTSSQERTLLKNLGCWLGSLTLAKNKPIKYKDLALKVCLHRFSRRFN